MQKLMRQPLRLSWPKVLTLLAFIAAVLGAGVVYQTVQNTPLSTDSPAGYGIQMPGPKAVSAVLPESQQHPVVVKFETKYCTDCQRMAPGLAQVLRQYPQVRFKKYEMLDIEEKAPAVANLFQPVSVPVLVLIAPGGSIQQVFYGYQSPETLAAAFQRWLG